MRALEVVYKLQYFLFVAFQITGAPANNFVQLHVEKFPVRFSIISCKETGHSADRLH